MANGIRLLVGLAILSGSALAQDAPISTVRISTEPAGARFYVDGQKYEAPQIFLWPQGSKHIVQFGSDYNPDGTPTGCQVSRQGLFQYCFASWADSTGSITPAGAMTQTFTASPSLTWIQAGVRVLYRVYLRFIDLPSGTQPLNCSEAPGHAPQDYLRTGLVFVQGVCFGSSADLWLERGSVALNAIPYPGFVFKGWNIDGAVFDSYLKTYNLTNPVTILADFQPAKRVQFVTRPARMKLLIDRTQIPTTAVEVEDKLAPEFPNCQTALSIGPRPPITIPALCFGEFDFLPGSKHILAAVTPQTDGSGNWWVFDKFSNGLEQNGVYVPDANTAVRDVITANFVPGVQAAFLTSPPGLKLNIDGRENWPAYNFIWGAGTKHTIGAAASQVDAKGRRWIFQGWSNEGSATQEIVADAAHPDVRLIATYSGMGQVKVLTNPPGIKLVLDGTECTTPCVLDRDAGAEIWINTPASVPLDETSRLDFLGWSDGASANRKYKIGAEPTTIFANYGRAYRLLVTSDPAGGVDIQTDPPSADGFFPEDSVVTVTATPRPGFKFRRWNGDVVGVYPSAQLAISGPRTVIAAVDRVPYLAPAGIKNAAGDTPENTVAPGSIISIFGESLAPLQEIGPRNPLAQTLADVVVTIGDRMLPLLFVSPQQINAQVLSDLPDGEHTLRVRWTGKPDVTGTFTISRNSPGLFSASGESDLRYSMAIHEDGTTVTPDSPARRGEMVTVYGTGFGPYNQKIIDGFVFPEPSSFQLIDPVEIKVGALSLRPEWAGGAPGYAGMTATRFRITEDIPSAGVDLQVNVNGKLSNTVVLPVE